MSYDGGLSVKIENPKLLAILKEYQSIGTFDDDIVNVLGIGKRSKERQLAIHYAYFDCAYSHGCPKSLDQLTPCLMSFLDDLLDGYVNKDLYSTLKEELENELKAIENEVISYMTENGLDTEITDTAKITYKPQSRTTLDKEKLSEILGEDLKPFEKTTSFKVLRIK